jgi:hypothetical protein
MDEDSAGLAAGWEGTLSAIADDIFGSAPPVMQFLSRRCSRAAAAWVAVHQHVLPDFRARQAATPLPHYRIPPPAP